MAQSQMVSAIRKSSRQLVRELDILKMCWNEVSFSPIQCHTLVELEQQQSCTLTQLAQLLNMDKSNVSKELNNLKKKGLVAAKASKADQRQKLLHLTQAGQQDVAVINQLATLQVSNAIKFLPEAQQAEILKGIDLYVSALQKAKSLRQLEIRPIEQQDNAIVRTLIPEVMAGEGLPSEGCALAAEELQDAYSYYTQPRHHFLVILEEGEIVGCGGIAQLKDAPESVCELQKMYFREQLRGKGLGQYLLNQLLQKAREFGYQTCYLETRFHLKAATRLYQRNGFEKLDQAMGNTGHAVCQLHMAKDLTTTAF